MTPTRHKEKQVHMLMWAMLTLPIREDWSWRYLLEWAAIGGVTNCAEADPKLNNTAS